MLSFLLVLDYVSNHQLQLPNQPTKIKRNVPSSHVPSSHVPLSHVQEEIRRFLHTLFSVLFLECCNRSISSSLSVLMRCLNISSSLRVSQYFSSIATGNVTMIMSIIFSLHLFSSLLLLSVSYFPPLYLSSIIHSFPTYMYLSLLSFLILFSFPYN